ncbi:MAG: hypothetical protein JWN78_1473 [Bacteroidota bacterium]|nr:hypothetical protein [Bacteroidota bacterium]
MKISLLLLFSVSLTNNLSAQVYCKNDLVVTAEEIRNYKTDSLFIAGDYQNSLALALENIKDPHDEEAEDVFARIIRSYAGLGKTDSALIWTDSLLTKVHPGIDFYFFGEFNPLFHTKKFNEYYKSVIDSIKEKYPALNEEYYTQLLQIKNSGWMYLKMKADYKKLLSVSFKAAVDDLYKQSIINSFSILDKMIAKYAYPTTKNVGLEGVEISFLLVEQLTAINKEQEESRYSAIYDAAFKAGIVSNLNYAENADHHNIISNCSQEYGTQYWYDTTERKYNFYPISDVNNVDERRKLIGLEPIEAKRIGLDKVEMKDDGTHY